MRVRCYSSNVRYIRVTSTAPHPMAPNKTATLNLRIDPILKEALREAALREHRSVANMVELLIRRHCKAKGIAIPEQQSLALDRDK